MHLCGGISASTLCNEVLGVIEILRPLKYSDFFNAVSPNKLEFTSIAAGWRQKSQKITFVTMIFSFILFLPNPDGAMSQLQNFNNCIVPFTGKVTYVLVLLCI